MKRWILTLASTVTLVAVVGCSAAAPAPTPAPTKAAPPAATTAPAATKAPAVATAPAVAPTPVAAAKTSFPEKGKPVSLLIPWPTGGGNDIAARMLAGGMEKELGTPVNVVNKPGAGSQVGLAEGAASKPDGYTVTNTALPNTIGIYLEPERKATFDRKSFIPVANHTYDPITIAVRADSPYKTLQDMVDAAKAKPESVKAGTGGLMGIQHLSIVQLGRLSGAKFGIVHFEGGAQQVTNLLGGHIDVVFDFPPSVLPHVKSGAVRVLGYMDKDPYKFLPDAKTVESQGYKMYFATNRVFSVPVGTPKDVVDTLSNAIKKAMEAEDHKKRLDEAGMTARFMETVAVSTLWEDMEKEIAPLIPLAKQ